MTIAEKVDRYVNKNVKKDAHDLVKRPIQMKWPKSVAIHYNQHKLDEHREYCQDPICPFERYCREVTKAIDELYPDSTTLTTETIETLARIRGIK